MKGSQARFRLLHARVLLARVAINRPTHSSNASIRMR
jgi:hypothetical protein